MLHDTLSISATGANPLTVEVIRNGVVESRHRGSAVIVDITGTVRESWGEKERPIYPRSAIKVIQAIPVVESGAADAAGFTASEISLMCASHNGEPEHVDTATAMLTRLGLGESDLECGPQWPFRELTAVALAQSGEIPDQRHNNCSGKHSGMLALAKYLGAPTKSYIDPTHPVQQRILGVMEQMCGTDLSGVPPGVDGCSAPNWPIPLENLAFGFARLADPVDLTGARAKAINRIRSAVFEHPFMVAGTDRFCTEVMQVLGSKAFIKTGAEGVFCAALPEYGLGVALKCDDGASRGSQTMMAAILRHIGVIEDSDAERMDPWLNPRLRNWNDRIVGEIRPATEWLTF